MGKSTQELAASLLERILAIKRGDPLGLTHLKLDLAELDVNTLQVAVQDAKAKVPSVAHIHEELLDLEELYEKVHLGSPSYTALSRAMHTKIKQAVGDVEALDQLWDATGPLPVSLTIDGIQVPLVATFSAIDDMLAEAVKDAAEKKVKERLDSEFKALHDHMVKIKAIMVGALAETEAEAVGDILTATLGEAVDSISSTDFAAALHLESEE